MTESSAPFNVLSMVGIYAGTLIKEPNLTTEFDDAYLKYKKAVPMRIPWKIFHPIVSSVERPLG